MKEDKYKVPKKGGAKRLRELYENRRGKPSAELLEILKAPKKEKSDDKISAKPSVERDLEI